jgi:hypothetical protein
MLTILGEKTRRLCDDITRRNFLKTGAFGAGLTLADILRLRAVGEAPQRPAKSVILVFLLGGPSHIDMYDLKPDAPAEYRGEFKPIATNVPGVRICEFMPLQARMWDKLAVIRSVIAVERHSNSLPLTGYSDIENRTAHHPSIGAVISKLRGDSGGVPPFVSLDHPNDPTDSYRYANEPGYLGVGHRPFMPTGPGVENLRLARGMTLNTRF